MTALRQRVTFADPPAAGLAICVDGQRYDLTGREPYVRQDGSDSELLVWVSACVECDAPFECRSRLTSLPEVRRCGEHKMPGRRFDPDRRRRIAEAAGENHDDLVAQGKIKAASG
jgi:hypothetical protein